MKDRLARWRAAQEKALGIEQTETLPEMSESDVLDTPHLRWVQVSNGARCGAPRRNKAGGPTSRSQNTS